MAKAELSLPLAVLLPTLLDVSPQNAIGQDRTTGHAHRPSIADAPSLNLGEAFQPIHPLSHDRGFVRHRRVFLDRTVVSALRIQPVPSFELEAFADLAFRVSPRDIVQRANGVTVITGWIDDHPESLAVIVVDDKGLTGTFHPLNGEVIAMDPEPEGTHIIRQYDTKLFPACGVVDARPPSGNPPHGGVLRGAASCMDNGAFIDVMVLYANSVASAYAALQSRIQAMIAEANAAYSVSGIETRLRLVHTAQVTFDETGTESTLLAQLTNPSDGVLDVAHSLRDQYKADLVSLLVLNWGPCGVANILNDLSTDSESMGFNVTQSGCAFFNLSFAHEVGHNLSNMHERESTTNIGIWDYGRGYRLASGSFRTIMATMSATAPRIAHFSNPYVLYAGEPTGIGIGEPDAAFATRATNQVALTVANYRPTLDCDDDGLADTTEIAGNATLDANFNGVLDACEADCNGNEAPDSCDLLGGGEADCNANRVPDVCDLQFGTSQDCTLNGVPDDCEPDCNVNGIADSCDIQNGTSEDCDGAAHGNQVPDECEEDCNGNSVADSCDIALGESDDQNGDGVPDECGIRRYVNGTAAGANNGLSWSSAYLKLEDALADAAANSGPLGPYSIWVKSGTYRPAGSSGDRNASFFLPSYTEVLGGFAGGESSSAQRQPKLNVTVLSGDLNGDDGAAFINRTDNCYHVIEAVNVGSSAVLDGVVVSGGYASSSYPNNNGAGVWIDGGSPQFRGCTFTDNWATTSGGGAYTTNLGAPLFDRCVFRDNKSNGDGAALGNNFAGNVTVRNSLMMGNIAVQASVLQNGGVNPTFATLVNCTVYANVSTSSGTGSAIRNSTGAQSTLVNSIVWANSRAGIVDQQAAFWMGEGVVANYNIVQGWSGSLGGVGNSPENPQFVNDAPSNLSLADLHLQASSPAVDAGDNGAMNSTSDLDGLPRLRGPNVDLGAWELQPAPTNPIPAASIWGMIFLGAAVATIGARRILRTSLFGKS